MATADMPADNQVRESVEARVIPALAWKVADSPNLVECRFVLCPEDEGGFSAHSTNLKGVVSEGDDFDEAVRNMREAFSLMLEEYRGSMERIPWLRSVPASIKDMPNSIELWITVDV